MIEPSIPQGDFMHYGEAELLPFGSLGYGQTAAQKIEAKQARQVVGAKGGSGAVGSRTEEVYIEELGESIEVPSISRLSAALQKAGYDPGKAAIFANQIQQAYIAGDLSSLNTNPILKSLALQFAQSQIVAQESQIELERLQNIQASIGTDAELASQYLEATSAEAAALAESERQRLAAEAAVAEARFQRNKKIVLGILGVSVLGYFAYRFTR
jgi:hypothetical protein